jgi:hypothetical protein
MKYNMHVGQLRRQFQLVNHFTSLLQNLEWSNEPQCELASDLQMTQTSLRRHLEVHKIFHFKAQLSSPMIGVALLPQLCNSQVLPNHMNLLLGFLHNVGSKHLPFSSLTPKQRSPTPSTIQHLKRCHLQAFLIVVVIGELDIRQTLIPTSSILQGTSS